MINVSVVHLHVRELHVTRNSVFTGPRNHSGKIFQYEICWKACEVTVYLHSNNE